MGEVSVVDRTQDDAAFDSLANSPTIQTEWTRDSCANIFGNELASIIARRLRVYTRTCSSLAWALSYDIESAVFFIFRVFVYPIDLSFIPVTRNATRTLCSTFVPEPAHQSPCDEWAKNLFFLRYYFQFGRNRHTYFSVPSVRSDIGSRCTFQRERERKKEFCGTSRSGRARVRCGISSSVENNSGKSIVVRRVEWWIEERINSKTNLGRPDVRLNAIARFIFNLLAEESPSMQFKRSRRISFQTRNDDFLFDGRSPLNARVRVRCYKSVEVSALYPAVDVISVDSQLSHVR